MISKRPQANWNSSDFVRQISLELTENAEFDAQDNIEFLRNYLNKEGGGPFVRATWANGVGRFYATSHIFRYDFRRGSNPTSERFRSAFDAFHS